jgi:hypothetical protein
MTWLIIWLSEVLFGVQGTVQIMKHLIVQLPLSSCQFLSPVSNVFLTFLLPVAVTVISLIQLLALDYCNLHSWYSLYLRDIVTFWAVCSRTYSSSLSHHPSVRRGKTFFFWSVQPYAEEGPSDLWPLVSFYGMGRGTEGVKKRDVVDKRESG